jgi:hypothetical protein
MNLFIEEEEEEKRKGPYILSLPLKEIKTPNGLVF